MLGDKVECVRSTNMTRALSTRSQYTKYKSVKKDYINLFTSSPKMI